MVDEPEAGACRDTSAYLQASYEVGEGPSQYPPLDEEWWGDG